MNDILLSAYNLLLDYLSGLGIGTGMQIRLACIGTRLLIEEMILVRYNLTTTPARCNMKLRIASVDINTLEKCIIHEVWGSNGTSISTWNVGDLLIFKIKDSLVAMAEIVGDYYIDDSIVWENGYFINRIPIRFLKVLSLNNAIDFKKTLKPLFLTIYGKQYGWVILNKHPIDDSLSLIINNLFVSA